MIPRLKTAFQIGGRASTGCAEVRPRPADVDFSPLHPPSAAFRTSPQVS
jgi:hypothetical protein